MNLINRPKNPQKFINNKQTERQTDRQMDRQSARKTYTQTDR